MEFYLICGKCGSDGHVMISHTNKWYLNFDFMIQDDVEKIYDNIREWKHGTYISKYGYQNGYDEIGYMKIFIAHSSNGRTPDSDSGYCGSNP